MRHEVSANLGLYDADAREQIDEAIARVEDVLRKAQLMVCGTERNLEAA